VKDKTIVTAPLDIGILDGITRATTLTLARKLAPQKGWRVRETRFPKERLYEADEVFMTSTVKEVFPVTQVDGTKISGGKPGPITRVLNHEFKKEIQRLLS
jgi:branched-subunit amino acid aminotransferase/4-amino-4-deoxychorismate lyase